MAKSRVLRIRISSEAISVRYFSAWIAIGMDLISRCFPFESIPIQLPTFDSVSVERPEDTSSIIVSILWNLGDKLQCGGLCPHSERRNNYCLFPPTSSSSVQNVLHFTHRNSIAYIVLNGIVSRSTQGINYYLSPLNFIVKPANRGTSVVKN